MLLGHNGFTQLMIEEIWISEVGVCSPVGANFVRLGVAANPSLWQTTPQCHFGYGVYHILHDQPLAPFLTHEVYNPSRMFNLLTLPWAVPTVRLAGYGLCPQGFAQVRYQRCTPG